MTDKKLAVQIKPEPGSRLAALAAEYDQIRWEADEAKTRLDELTTAIKAELSGAAPEATVVDLASEHLTAPLRLSYVKQWRVDAKRLKTEDPETYVRYAKQSGYWQLKAVS